MTLRCHNRVLLLLLVMFVAATQLPFVSLAANRLMSGTAVYLTSMLNAEVELLLGLGTVLLALAFVPGRAPVFLTLVAAEVLFASLLWWCGGLSRGMMLDVSPLARVSIGSGLWLMLAIALLMFSDAARRLVKKPLWRGLIFLQLWAIPLVLLAYDWFDALSLLKEYENRREVFNLALGQHLILLFGTLVPSLLIGVPLGLWCYRRPSFQPPVFAVLSVIQTVPSVALFGLLMVPLALLAAALPLLGDAGISGIGLAPALIALVLYALLPLVRGVVSGLAQVPHDVLETAHAMGMTRQQIFVRAQVPLAMPVLLRSLRVVAIQTIGMAAIAALSGAGGFGTLVFQGLMSSAVDLVLLGVMPIMALAVLVDALFNFAIAALEVQQP